MELIKQHIIPHLNSFTNESLSSLNNILEEIQNDSKTDKYTKIIHYFDKILNLSILSAQSDLTCLHIHFDDEFDDSQKLLLAEFILIKFYYQEFTNSIEQENNLNDEIQRLTNRVNHFSYPAKKSKDYPFGLSNQEYNKIVHEHRKNKELIKFYKIFNKKVKIKLLFNSTVNIINSLIKKFEFKPFAKEIKNEVHSFNLLNKSQTLNEIDNDKINSQIIEELDSVILFDCERKRLMTNFSFEEIKKWNTDYGTRFTKYLVITFGKENSSINNTRNKIELIRERFKIPKNNTYTIAKTEIDFLLNRKVSLSPLVEFAGDELSVFWDNFILETSILGLYELRSIKLMNIYSICYTDEIKNYIIGDIFSNSEASELISSTTKLAILELSEDDIDNLKEVLSSTLDVIINLDIKSKVYDSLLKLNTPSIILDEAILRNQNLLTKIRNCLGLTNLIQFKTWSDFSGMESNDYLILSYRDQGRYPNYYYPNLLEIRLGTPIKAIFPNFLFGYIYKWSKYHLQNEYHKLLAHPIRDNYFKWNKLKNKIIELKPEQKLNIDWNLENEYSNSDQRETYRVKLKGQRVKTAYSSDLFIISEDNNVTRKVAKIDYLLTTEIDDNPIFVQNLNEIQENINIYEKIVDKKQQDEELKVIRQQFNLDENTEGYLWKILLKRLADQKGEEELYNEMKAHFETKGLKMVSQFHFKNTWINPDSESIAPLSKKVFIELCEYLNIPKTYFIIIQRIRNSTKQTSRQSTRQMNLLLKDLFNDGCFDRDKNPRDIINNRLAFYKENHPLDELGIDENFLADNLVALVELIIPELNLIELETIQKNSNE